MNQRKKLADIVRDVAALKQVWATTKAAPELKPIPPGEYLCELTAGDVFESKNGTPGYKVTLRVAEGDFAGRLVWHDYYLSEKALPFTMRAFNAIGITDLDQLDDGIPAGLVVKAKIVLRKRDSGDEHNEVRSWQLVSVSEGRGSAPTSTTPAPWDVNPDAPDEATPKGGDATLFPTDDAEGSVR